MNKVAGGEHRGKREYLIGSGQRMSQLVPDWVRNVNGMPTLRSATKLSVKKGATGRRQAEYQQIYAGWRNQRCPVGSSAG
jgi:hypothetical protein